MQNWGLLLIIVCLNDDPRLTLTYLTARSNFVTAFSIGKVKTMDFQKLLQPVTLKMIEADNKLSLY